MATVAEKFQGVSGDRTSRQIDFIVRDATDESDAISATLVYLGVNYGMQRDGIPLQNVSVKEISYPKGIFSTSASFSTSKPEEPETGDIEISFQAQLDTRRIYRSYETVGQYKLAEASSRATYGKIDAQEGEEAKGADVRVPVGGFSVSWFAPQASVTESYRKTVLDTVGKVNNDSFYGNAAGEVLFAGVTGRARNADDWELVFQFETSPNEQNLTIGTSPHQITNVDVGGWQYLWVDYKEDKSGAEQISYPERCYVERVYEWADFSQLGIGT